MQVSDRQLAAGVAVAVVAHIALFMAAGWVARPGTPPDDSPQGVMISLDDFDTGPSPPTSLDDLPIENLADNQAVAAPDAQSESARPVALSAAADIDTPPAAAIGPEPAVEATEPGIAQAASAAPPSAPTPTAAGADAAITAAVSVTPDNTATDQTPSEQVVARDALNTGNKAGDTPAVTMPNGAYGDSQQATDDYITHVRAWLARHKQYPQAARQAKAQGTAKLYLDIDSNGNVRAHRIVQSSGSPALDQAVEAMLARSLPLPAMPSASGRNRLEIVIPIVFTLR